MIRLIGCPLIPGAETYRRYRFSQTNPNHSPNRWVLFGRNDIVRTNREIATQGHCVFYNHTISFFPQESEFSLEYIASRDEPVVIIKAAAPVVPTYDDEPNQFQPLSTPRMGRDGANPSPDWFALPSVVGRTGMEQSETFVMLVGP